MQLNLMGHCAASDRNRYGIYIFSEKLDAKTLSEHYSGWDKLDVYRKQSILKSTVRYLQNADAVQAADFCLTSLGQVNLWQEKCKRIVRLCGPKTTIGSSSFLFVINDIKDSISQKATLRKYDPSHQPNDFYLVTYDSNYFLMRPEAISSSETLKNLNHLEFNSWNNGERFELNYKTFVLALSILSKTDSSQQLIEAQIKRKDVIELQKVRDFFKFQGKLAEKVEHQLNGYLVRKWKKAGIEEAQPCEAMLLDRINAGPIDRPEQLDQLIKLKKSLLKIEHSEQLDFALEKNLAFDFSKSPGGLLNKREIDLLKGFVRFISMGEEGIKFDFENPDHITFKTLTGYHRAHYLLMDHLLSVKETANGFDPVLYLKASFLRWTIHGHGNFDKLIAHFKNYPRVEWDKIFKTIENIFKLKPQDYNFRSQLLEIITLAPQAQKYFASLMDREYILSKDDPLYVRCLEEFRRSGFKDYRIERYGAIITILNLSGVYDIIRFCKNLNFWLPEDMLNLMTDILSKADLNVELPKHQLLDLFNYAIDIVIPSLKEKKGCLFFNMALSDNLQNLKAFYKSNFPENGVYTDAYNRYQYLEELIKNK